MLCVTELVYRYTHLYILYFAVYCTVDSRRIYLSGRDYYNNNNMITASVQQARWTERFGFKVKNLCAHTGQTQ